MHFLTVSLSPRPPPLSLGGARSRANCQGGPQFCCRQMFCFLPIESSTMPVEGLPSTLEGALSVLIKENPLTSFKIDGRGDNIVVVLRFSTGQPNDTATRRCRLKPPSQLARDERRADIRQGQVSGDSSPTPLFMPTPPGQVTEKSHEISYMKSHLTGLHQRDDTFHDYTANEFCSAAAEATLDSECFFFVFFCVTLNSHLI